MPVSPSSVKLVQITDTWIEAGDKFAEPVGGVVVWKDGLLVGFRSLAFAVRMVEDKYELVHL